MKIVNKNNQNKNKTKKKPQVKVKKEQVLLVAQEIKFARLLSGNETKTRDKVLKSLKKWLVNCFEKNYDFKEFDFLRVWKGLFYAMWMSDKPLVQEDLSESIAAILDLFPPEHLKHAVLMMKAGFKTLATEWFGIDHHRMDKFLMLVRRYLRGCFRCLLRCEWSEDSCSQFANMLSEKDGLLAIKTPLYARNATSMVLHFIDCYLEELSKVSKGALPPSAVATLMRPFCVSVCLGPLSTCVASRALLTSLLRHAPIAAEGDERTRAWYKMGCPGKGPDELELVPEGDDSGKDDGGESDEELDDNSPLDPRAGRVHVSLRPLPVPASSIAAAFKELLPTAPITHQKRAKICMQRFEKLARDENPLPVPTAVDPEPLEPQDPEESAAKLHSMERKLIVESDELALRGLSRKHRKRLLSKTRAGLSIVEETEGIQAKKKQPATDGWSVEETEPKAKKKKDLSNKENVNKNKKDKKQKLKGKKQEKVISKKLSGDKQVKTTKVKETVLTVKHKKSELKVGTKCDKVLMESPKKVVKDKPKKPVQKLETKVKPVIASKIRKFEKKTSPKDKKEKNKKTVITGKVDYCTPKKVKFVLKNNSMQGTGDYYKSVRSSPSIPFDSTKKPTKTNLKPSTPSPINPFFKKKMKLRK